MPSWIPDWIPTWLYYGVCVALALAYYFTARSKRNLRRGSHADLLSSGLARREGEESHWD